jgi:hypothetical protein
MTKSKSKGKSTAGKRPAIKLSGKLRTIRGVLKDSKLVASVKIVGRQRREKLLRLFRGVHEKWVVTLKPPMKADEMLPTLAEELPDTIATAMPPTITKAVYALMAQSGGTVVVMMVKETSQAQDV